MSLHSKPLGALLTFVVAVLLSASTAFASPQDTLTQYTFGNTYPATAAIGQTFDIPIYKIDGVGMMSGFDFLLRYNENAMTLVNVYPGYIFLDTSMNGWEFFDHSEFSDAGYGFVRGVGIADIEDGDNHPLSLYIPNQTPLFYLQFTITNDSLYACDGYPIEFYWQDCTDNAIAADTLGAVLGISNLVFDWNGNNYVNITDTTFGVPGRNGAPDDCITDPSIMRLCNFYNGFVDVACGDDTVYVRGDINCNDVAYEIADLVLFYNYFLYGSTTFLDFACSQSRSDANADGQYLDIEDAIYLYRVVAGDAQPYDTNFIHNHVGVTFTQYVDAQSVVFNYTGELAAIYLAFNGEITPTININEPNIITTYSIDSGVTRVLVYPDVTAETPGFYADTLILTYSGEGILYEAGAADYEDHVFDAQIAHIGGVSGTPFAFRIGYFPDVESGQSLSIPVTKMVGSEDMYGLDFLFGYDEALFGLSGVTAGLVFDNPGSYEWEYFTYRYDASDCGDTICPPNVLRVVAVADLNDGPHHPLSTSISDGTVLFTIDGFVTSDTIVGDVHADMRFLWIDCGDNAVAFGDYGEDLALSRYVFTYNGYDITSPYMTLPTRYGAPESCLSGSATPPVRFADFVNGGFEINGGGGDTTGVELVLTVGNADAYLGDTAIYLDVYLSNPQDSVAAFSLVLQLDNPELVKFGISPNDTLAFSTVGTLTENWQLMSQSSFSGTYTDLKIVGFANASYPYDHSIPPQEDGLLLRLMLHAIADTMMADTVTTILINESPEFTAFSDQLGYLIGLDGTTYNANTVFFTNGHIFMQEDYLAGDCNADGYFNIGDAVSLIDYIFKGGNAPQPICTGDVNCDGYCNVADPVYIVNYIFRQGSAPCTGCR
ncbi:MAG: hypothetical protein R3F48_11815 [Candidatus Zixiibacteriota bacterium]